MALAAGRHGDVGGLCACGLQYDYPVVLDTGVRPNQRSAERARTRAFRAAGLVRNLGGFALGTAVLGIPCFPLGLVGALVGVYSLLSVRGPMARYSGRGMALAAVLVGGLAFGTGGSLTVRWLRGQRAERLSVWQADARQDLQALLRVQRLQQADSGRYLPFAGLHFSPPAGRYTLYLGPEDVLLGHCGGKPCRAPLPPSLALVPVVRAQQMTAVAVANLDGDAALDVWAINEAGLLTHLHDDLLE